MITLSPDVSKPPIIGMMKYNLRCGSEHYVCFDDKVCGISLILTDALFAPPHSLACAKIFCLSLQTNFLTQNKLPPHTPSKVN